MSPQFQSFSRFLQTHGRSWVFLQIGKSGSTTAGRWLSEQGKELAVLPGSTYQVEEQQWILRSKFTPEETGSHSHIKWAAGREDCSSPPTTTREWRTWVSGSWQDTALRLTAVGQDELDEEERATAAALAAC